MFTTLSTDACIRTFQTGLIASGYENKLDFS